MATQEEEFEEFFKELEESMKEDAENEEEKSEEEPTEGESEGEKALTKADVIKIVRDEIKTFWKGVLKGKYPLPAKYPYAKYPYAKYPYAKYPAPASKKSLDEGDFVPMYPAFVVVPQMQMQTDSTKSKDVKIDSTEQKNAQTDSTKDDGKDDIIEEQKSQIEELKKTVEDLQKKLEEISAQPAPEKEEDEAKPDYVSDVLIDGDTISRP